MDPPLTTKKVNLSYRMVTRQWKRKETLWKTRKLSCQWSRVQYAFGRLSSNTVGLYLNLFFYW